MDSSIQQPPPIDSNLNTSQASHAKPKQFFIKIATQQPSIVFGGGHPMDTINKYLARSYQSGFFTPGHIFKGLALMLFVCSSTWYYSTYHTGKLPKTLSKEWKAATVEYNREQGSDWRYLDSWRPGQPVPIPKTSEFVKD